MQIETIIAICKSTNILVNIQTMFRIYNIDFSFILYFMKVIKIVYIYVFHWYVLKQQDICLLYFFIFQYRYTDITCRF